MISISSQEQYDKLMLAAHVALYGKDVWDLLLIISDWKEEQGDPYAEGYRIMSREEKWPACWDTDGGHSVFGWLKGRVRDSTTSLIDAITDRHPEPDPTELCTVLPVDVWKLLNGSDLTDRGSDLRSRGNLVLYRYPDSLTKAVEDAARAYYVYEREP